MASRSRFRAATVSFLPRPDWFYLAALLVPAALFDLALSWLRVTTQYAAPTGLAALGQLRSDVLAHLGFALLWVVAFALLRSGWPRIVLLAVAQVSVAAYLMFAVVAHSYYRKSGSILDAGGLRMTLQDPEATRNIAASETSSASVWLLVVVAAYAIVGPALMYRLRYRGLSPRGRWLPGVGAVRERRSAVAANGRRRLSLLAVATGLVLVVAAAVPSFTGGGAFARNRALDIGLELGSGLLESERASAERPALSSTELVGGTRRTGAATEEKPRNVVLITMESVRSEATSARQPGSRHDPVPGRPGRAQPGRRERVHGRPAHLEGPDRVELRLRAAPGHQVDRVGAGRPARPPACRVCCATRATAPRSSSRRSGSSSDRPDLIRNLGYDEFFPVEAFPTAGFGRANYFGWEDDIMLEPSRDWLPRPGRRAVPDDVPDRDRTPRLPAAGHLRRCEHLSDDEELNNYLNGARYVDRFVSQVFAMLAEEGLPTTRSWW